MAQDSDNKKRKRSADETQKSNAIERSADRPGSSTTSQPPGLRPQGKAPHPLSENLEWIQHEGIGQRRRSLVGHRPFWLNAPGRPYDYEKETESRVSKPAQRAWLGSSAAWSQRLGPGWVGRKVLGMGGYGICGLWELPEGVPLSEGLAVRRVVVKQVRLFLESVG